MLLVLRNLLKSDCLSHAASARLQVACRALAQVRELHEPGSGASACVKNTTYLCDGPQQSCDCAVAPHHAMNRDDDTQHITPCTVSPSTAVRVIGTPVMQHGLRLRPWHTRTRGLLSHAGRASVRSYAALSAAGDGHEPQQSMQTAEEAAAQGSDAEGATAPPQGQHAEAAQAHQSGSNNAAAAGDSTASAAPEPGKQPPIPSEAEAAAETAELDEMLQRMAAEAEDMILGGHPQEAIQHLTEVAEQLEAQLGADHFLSYRLWDQITQLHQEQGQHEDSLNVASRALSSLAGVADAGPVAAMFRMRRGAALFAMGHINPALKDFAEAAEYLRGAFSPDFEAIGEARLYMALARVREAKDAEDVGRLEPRLREALKHMQQDKTDRGAALREAGMRQHDRIIDAASAAGNWPLTLALYEQQAALLRSAGMKHKLLALLYTHSTLLYIRNAAGEAEPIAREGVALSRQLYPSADDEVTLRTLRLGTILLERGQFMEAAGLVEKAAARFEEALQPDNPVRGEAAFASALARMFQLMPFQVAERRQLLDDMSAGLGVMAAGFGQEHQLVRKAAAIWESSRRMVDDSKS